MGIAVGIDLGTTFSAIARINEYGQPEIIKNREDRPLTPSVVAVCENPPLVGDGAKQLQALGEKGVESLFKRAMGDPQWRLEWEGRGFTPTDLSALVLGKLKADAEARLRETVDEAVITVPAYFNDPQREATKAAGEAAGLNVLMTINEPTAAALAFGLRSDEALGRILVYDLGGGTFDVTLIEITAERIEALATDGHHELGGKDWDDRLTNYVANEFYAEHGERPLEDRESYSDILVASERTKIDLSGMSAARMRITHAGLHASYTVEREQFENMTRDLLERTSIVTENVLAEQGLAWGDLQGVLLVGGATRMPMVRQFVLSRFGREPITGVNVDEAVALGAAIKANQMVAQPGGDKVYSLPAARVVEDVTSHSLGMIALNDDRSAYVNSIILAKNQPIRSDHTRPYKLRTSSQGTNELEVYITQGESTVPAQCTLIGKYTADRVPHHPQGEAVIDITYAYNESGMVQVTAVDRTTRQPLDIRKEPLPDDMSWVEQPPETTSETVPAQIAVLLCIDVSGSMSGDPLNEAKEAAREFVRQMDLSSSSVGIVAFGTRAKLVTETCRDARQLDRAIKSLSISGTTNMAAAIKTAHEQLSHDRPDPGAGSTRHEGCENALRFVVLLTDGMPNNRRGALNAAQSCHDDGIDIVTIGTSAADRKFLAQLASTDQANIFAQSGQLVEVFGSIAQQITEGGGLLRRL